MLRWATNRHKLHERQPTKWLTLLLLGGILLTARNVFALALPGTNGRTLSGTYSFHASLKRRGKIFAASGSLEFDWLGDMSGEARLVPEEHGIASINGARCHVLISGNYSPAKQPGFYDATVTMVPVTSGCPVAYGTNETITVKVFPQDNHGDIGLLRAAKSGRSFVGAATLESRGPS